MTKTIGTELWIIEKLDGSGSWASEGWPYCLRSETETADRLLLTCQAQYRYMTFRLNKAVSNHF